MEEAKLIVPPQICDQEVPNFIVIFIFFGCTSNQGSGIFNVNAEVTAIGHTMLSVKYYIGDTVIFDDIPMKTNTGILQMIKDSGNKTVPLKIVIEFTESDENNRSESSFKYYYGANFLSDSLSHNLESILLIAKENQDIFSWIYRDGNLIKEMKKAPEPAEMESTKLEPIDKLPRKEKAEKL